MPQPTFVVSSLRANATFGGMALPNGQGIQASINLNDGVNTRLRNFNIDESNKQISLAQLLYIGRGVTLSRDFGPRGISLPMQYIEDSTHTLGAFLASLSQAGEQQLSFDNRTTLITGKYNGISGRKRFRLKPPVGWEFALELVARNPWFQDAAATVATPWNPITVDAGQDASITYVGSVWAEPVWTLNIPAQPQNVLSMQLKSTMWGVGDPRNEALTIDFQSGYPGGIPAGHTVPVIIDCAAMTVSGVVIGVTYNFDVAGSFPKLYGPPGQVNPFTAIITMASGFSTATITLAYSVYPRWQI